MTKRGVLNIGKLELLSIEGNCLCGSGGDFRQEAWCSGSRHRLQSQPNRRCVKAISVYLSSFCVNIQSFDIKTYKNIPAKNKITLCYIQRLY